MSEQIAPTNGIEIAYQTFGERSDPALLLVMGLGAQLIHWPEEFCELLAARGFHVVRFDNRDVGLSTKISDAPVPDLMALAAGNAGECSLHARRHGGRRGRAARPSRNRSRARRRRVDGRDDRADTGCQAPAARALDLLDHVDDRQPDVGQARPEAISVLLTPVPTDRDSYVDFHIRAFKAIGSPGFPFDEEFLRWRAEATFDRSVYPDGFKRQLAAIIASGDRTEALAQVTAPTVVIHGSDDPLITVSGGEATARAIPGAKLVVIPGMGHDLPRGAWPEIVDAITANTERAKTTVGDPARG